MPAAVAAGRNAARLEWLQKVGADAVINVGTDDLGSRVAAEASGAAL